MYSFLIPISSCTWLKSILMLLLDFSISLKIVYLLLIYFELSLFLVNLVEQINVQKSVRS